MEIRPHFSNPPYRQTDIETKNKYITALTEVISLYLYSICVMARV